MAKKVLVGCPIYDGDAQYLEGFLESARKQTFLDFDILFADTSKEDTFSEELRKTGALVIRAPTKSGERMDNIISGRNAVRDFFLKKDYDFLWFVDADVRPPKDALAKLLNDRRDIVSGVCLNPFSKSKINNIRPCLWVFTEEKGVCKQLSVDHVSASGVIDVAIAGFGCVLISRKVIEKIGVGLFEGHKGSEDTIFFVKALKEGFKIAADLDVKCDHLVFSVGDGRNKLFSFD
jgi:glycosyltransferase involved in cell wall biosynthesis